MGREIRRVPPNWQHPVYTKENARRSDRIGDFIPMHDQSYEDARTEWIDGFEAWQRGEHPEQIKYPEESWVKGQDFWEYDSPPDREGYRPAFTEAPTWFQMYETVSEGTPCSPPFATEEELIQYLMTEGGLHRRQYPELFPLLTRAQAERFVKAAWAPSMIVTGGVITQGIQGA